MCAKGFFERIEDSFAFRRKASKNEDSLLDNGVDGITNFRVVQQQVYELCDLKIIDSDSWFTFLCYDKIVLYSFFQL